MTVIDHLLQTTTADSFASSQPFPKQQAPLPLSMAATGQPLRLIAVHTEHKLSHRLAELGLTPGVELTVVQDAGGPLLVAVRGSRIAIGRGIAHLVQVAPIT
jgi:Fe2+ transport system protein FeoA